jgi:hypothetical protein
MKKTKKQLVFVAIYPGFSPDSANSPAGCGPSALESSIVVFSILQLI